MAQSKEGYRFLCRLLQIIYQDERWKDFLEGCIRSGQPMEKKTKTASEYPLDIQTLRSDLSALARNVRRSRPELEKLLDETLNEYYEDGISRIDPTQLFKDSAEDVRSVTNSFNGLFAKQNSVANDIFASIALVITMAVGYKGYNTFFIGNREVRQLLDSALGCLGYPYADFIPQDCLRADEKTPDPELLKLLVVSLFGAMKYRMPHKDSQKQANYLRGREAIQRLIQTKKDSQLYCAVCNGGAAQRICEGLREGIGELSRTEIFPDRSCVELEAFYELPVFEPEDSAVICNPRFLGRDLHAGMRSMIIGAKGSGKTLLTKVVVRTCLEDADRRSGFYQDCAQRMGLDDGQYLPLVLDCGQLPRCFHPEELDLISAALEQTCQQVRGTEYAQYMDHWQECRSLVEQYYRQKAADSEALLIIENLSSLQSSLQEGFVRRIKELDRTEQVKINILVTTRQLPRAVLGHFWDYNRVQIAQPPLENAIRKLTACGVGRMDVEQYVRFIDGDWMLQEYLKTSSEHLIRMVCGFLGRPAEVDELIRKTIREQLECCSTADISGEACETLLTAIAVSVVEEQERGRNAGKNLYGARSVFRRNHYSQESVRAMLKDPEQAAQVWNYIEEKMVLIRFGHINGCQFTNPLFACSLTADYYLSKLYRGEPENWLERFNRLHAEDFAVILRMMLTRYFQDTYGKTESFRNRTDHRLWLAVQSMAAYILGCTAMDEVYVCLQTLDKLLFDEEMEDNFRLWDLEKPWNLLRRVYWEQYEYFARKWGVENNYQLARLRKPEADPV